MNRAIAAGCSLLVLAACGPDTEAPAAAPRSAPSATTSPEPEATAGPDDRVEVVYYRLNPDPDQVDSNCGSEDSSYVARPVDVPAGSRAYLTHALEALFEEYWGRPAGQIEEVSIDAGLATIVIRSMEGLEFASASCGGNSFIGSIQRTAFQFDTVDKIRIELDGSCHRFGEFMQSGECVIRR